MQASILDSVLGERPSASPARQPARTRPSSTNTSPPIRDVEKRLELRQRWTHLPEAAGRPSASRPTSNPVDDLPLMYELIALALQTDSTRIATLEIGGDFMPQHLGIKKDYHGLSHHGNDEASRSSPPDHASSRYQIAQYRQSSSAPRADERRRRQPCSTPRRCSSAAAWATPTRTATPTSRSSSPAAAIKHGDVQAKSRASR